MMVNDYCENVLIQQTMADFLHDKLDWCVSYAHNKEKLGRVALMAGSHMKKLFCPDN